MIDKSKLERLPPEERISKLKELEKKLDERHKKDVLEIESLIKRSQQQLRSDKLADLIAPEQREIGVSGLFEKGSLENSLPPQDDSSGDYRLISQISQDYTELKALDGIVSQGYNLTQDQKELVGVIGQRITIAEKYAIESENAANLLTPSRAILYKLKKEKGA